MSRLPKGPSLQSASRVRRGWPLGSSSPSGPLPSDFNAGGAGGAKQRERSERENFEIRFYNGSKSNLFAFEKPRSFMAKTPFVQFVHGKKPRSFVRRSSSGRPPFVQFTVHLTNGRKRPFVRSFANRSHALVVRHQFEGVGPPE